MITRSGTRRDMNSRRHLPFALAASALMVGATVAVAQEAPGAAARIEERARGIGKELRCVVCQNQSIDESNAPLALDLKQLLRERLAAGDSDAQAKAFLVARYGNFVLLKPPLQANTLLLWLGPFLLLGVAGVTVHHYFRSRSDRAGTAALTPLTTADLAAADRILDQERER